MHNIDVELVDGEKAVEVCRPFPTCVEIENMGGNRCRDCSLIDLETGIHTIDLGYYNGSDGLDAFFILAVLSYAPSSILTAEAYRNYRKLSIELNAEAGREYEVLAFVDQKSTRHWVWVEDANTGEVIAGETGP